MTNLWKKFILYTKLPEMRLFWFVLPLFFALLIINFFYLIGLWLMIGLAIVLILAAVFVFNNIRLARFNLELKIERNELQTVINSLRDGVIVYDPDFKIINFNPAAEEIFGIKFQEIIGQRLTIEHSRDQRFKLISQVIFPSLVPVAIRRSEAGIYPQITDLSLDDPKVEFRVVTNRIIDPSGQLLGFIKLVRDRTRETALQRAQSEFITTAGHQMRTPLSALHWALENLSKEPLEGSQKETVNIALQTATKLLKIVNDLLDVSKIEEGRFGYQFEEISIIDLINNTINEAQSLAEQYKVKIIFQKPSETLPQVLADPQKLGMVLFNLIDNAVRYNVKNGEIKIEIKLLQDSSCVQISVQDTGLGIPPKQMTQLFTKFFRGENVVKVATEGSGLGLYIAQNIIQRHGGKIWAESQLNRGSTFYFTIPTDFNLVPQKEIIYGEE